MGTRERLDDLEGKVCVIYIRVSLEKQVEGWSIKGQEQELRKYAKDHKMIVKEVFTEEGRSGKSIEGRTEFQKMLEYTTLNRIDYVIVFKLSRFGRSAKDTLNSLDYLDKQGRGCGLLAVSDGINSKSAVGRLMITILSAVAEMERENINEQTMLGRIAKAKSGLWNGGFAPYGYILKDKKLFVDEEKAEIVKLIFDKFVNSDMGYSGIAAYLNRQGVKKLPAINSKRTYTDWCSASVKHIIDNPIYTGRMAYGRRKTTKVEGTENQYRLVKQNDYILTEEIVFVPLVSIEDFEKAQLKRKATGVKGNPKIGRERAHMLSGILKCPQCGGSMFIDKNMWTNKDGTKKETFSYVCGHYKNSRNGECSRNGIRTEVIEKEVVDYTTKLVKNKKFAEDINKIIGTKEDTVELDREIESLTKQYKKLERNKSNLEDEIDNLDDGDKFIESKRKDLNRRLNKMYASLYEVEEQLRENEARKEAVIKEKLDTDMIYKMLLVFDKVFPKLPDTDQRNFMQSIIKDIQLYNKEEIQSKRTSVKSITYSFPIDSEVIESLRDNENHVESVIMMRNCGSRAK